jgi:hypothetical protein
MDLHLGLKSVNLALKDETEESEKKTCFVMKCGLWHLTSKKSAPWLCTNYFTHVPPFFHLHGRDDNMSVYLIVILGR